MFRKWLAVLLYTAFAFMLSDTPVLASCSAALLHGRRCQPRRAVGARCDATGVGVNMLLCKVCPVWLHLHA